MRLDALAIFFSSAAICFWMKLLCRRFDIICQQSICSATKTVFKVQRQKKTKNSNFFFNDWRCRFILLPRTTLISAISVKTSFWKFTGTVFFISIRQNNWWTPKFRSWVSFWYDIAALQTLHNLLLQSCLMNVAAKILPCFLEKNVVFCRCAKWQANKTSLRPVNWRPFLVCASQN